MSQEQSLDVGFVFVDSGDKNLYQLRQWLQPLQRLKSRFTVRVFCTSLEVVSELEGSVLEAVYSKGQDELAARLYEQNPKVLLYPNQNVKNFYPLRFPKAVHVFVSHGESDKAYMSQNTVKRYDLYFAAGRAAIDRISGSVAGFDTTSRMIEIGRPQSLDTYQNPSDLHESDKRRVLYAPTWEGVTRATRYTSIVSHGQKLVQDLIDTGEYQVTYRPHPLSGSRDAEVHGANQAIKWAIQQANKNTQLSQTTRSLEHYIDESPFGWHLGYHDLMISDISAIAYDWLSTGKPILLTKPVEKKAVVEEFPLVEKLRSIKLSELDSLVDIVFEQFAPGSNQKRISEELNSYYFRQPINQSDAHFAEAIEQAISLRQQSLASLEFPKLQAYESRGGPLGLLRYPNFVIRETLRLAGIWSTTNQLANLSSADEIFVHLSDPFNGKSIIPSVSELLRLHQPGKKLVIVLNQVTGLLTISKLLRSSEFKNLAEDVVLAPVANASDCETVIAKLRPNRVNYLKHHPLNHMLLRLNGMEHVLWNPDLDPLFKADRSVITYDTVLGAEAATIDYLSKLLDVSRPSF